MSEFENVSEFADGEKSQVDTLEDDALAPVVSIEPVAMVRPIKVVAILSSFLACMFIGLSTASSEWLNTGNQSQGLWRVCYSLEQDVYTCQPNEDKDWMEAVRVLVLIALIVSFIALVVTSIGVTTANFKMKYSYYTGGMSLMFLAAVPEVVALVIFPVKYKEDYEIDSWGVGWSYVIAWVAAGLLLLGSILLCFDRSAEEIVYREQTCYQNESIEEIMTD